MKQKHRLIRIKGGRVAYTNTSRIPDKQVVDAIRFVAHEVDLDRTVIHFKRHGQARRWGMAYNGIPSIANLEGLSAWEWRYLITISDHGAKQMAVDVIDTLAHEAKHIEQFKHGRRGSEPAASAFGAGIADIWLLARGASSA